MMDEIVAWRTKQFPFIRRQTRRYPLPPSGILKGDGVVSCWID